MGVFLFMNQFIKDKSGVAATEFALIAPVFLLLLIGVIDYGVYMNNVMHLENTARSAAQYVVQGATPTL